MKKILSAILCVIMLITLCSVAFAAEPGKSFYIDSVSGNDENDGLSPASAWKTISRANEEI